MAEKNAPLVINISWPHLLVAMIVGTVIACFIFNPLTVIAFVGFLLVIVILAIFSGLIHNKLPPVVLALPVILPVVLYSLDLGAVFWNDIVPWTAAAGALAFFLAVFWVLLTTRGRTWWLDWRGIMAMQKGNYEKAERLFRRSLALREARYGKEHYSISSSMLLLATLAHERGDFEQVLALSEQLTDVQKRLLPENHPDFRGSLNLRITAIIGMGHFKEGIELCQHQLALLEKAPDARLPRMVVHHNLALCLMELGEYAKAEEMFHSVYDVLRKEPQHKLWGAKAYVMSLSAELSLRQQRPREAIKLAAEAVAHIEKQTAPYQGYRTAPMLRLARATLAVDRPHEALAIIEEVLSAQDHYFGPDHHFLAPTWHLRGEACVKLQRHTEAEKAFGRALQLCEQKLPTHPKLAEILDDWGWMLLQQGKVSEAAPLLRRALECRRSWLPDHHPDLALSLAHAAALHRQMGQEAEGQKLAAEAAAVRQRHEEREEVVSED